MIADGPHATGRSLQLDHVFICVCSGAPQAERLTALGLREGTPNTHPGQGTACRRFFFRNAYLELLWVHDPAEAHSAQVRPTRLWERWQGRSTGACPFGVGLRPKSPGFAEVPFATWEYRPPYLATPLSIQVGRNVDVLTEPMLFHLAFAQRPDAYPATERQRMEHPCGLREITRVELVSPRTDSRSRELQGVIDAGLVTFRAGRGYLLELGFDGERQQQKADFRPALPLTFCW